MMSPGMEVLVDELVGILDEEIKLLASKRSLLADLSEALIGRDNEATEGLLERIERADGTQTAVDLRLKAVRDTLAEALGYPAGELRLSNLVEELPQEQSLAVDYRRRQIVELADQLRVQHLQTALLLAECARINRMLLDTVLSAGEAVVTYGAGGADLWRPKSGLVDAEL